MRPTWALAIVGGWALSVGCTIQAPATGAPTDAPVPAPSLLIPSSPSIAPGLSAVGLPTLAPDAITNRTPTRVRVPDLGIDLPVVEPPPTADHYPFCGVAEFLSTMSRPGRPGTTYVYAHARSGMFLPILEASRSHDGRSMLGMRVDVFTSDLRRFTYEVTEVRRHVVSLDFAYRATREQLILQTSEGPHGTAGKTMLIAMPTGDETVSSSQALPQAEPRNCE